MLINLEFYWIIDKNQEATYMWNKCNLAFECEWVKVLAENRIEIGMKDNKKLIFNHYEDCFEYGYWLDRSRSDLKLIDFKCPDEHRDYIVASKIITSNGVIFEEKENYAKRQDIRE